MDALLPCGLDDVIVSNINGPPLLIQTSNVGTEVESPVFRLPTELTMLVFQHCESYIVHRLPLTHICRRWRHIAVNDASLWTNIHILTSMRSRNARLDNFLSFLGMQLDRAANLLLDVIWYAEVGDEFFVGTLQLIRDKAPFSRWRTLVVELHNGSDGEAPWSFVDAFTNLASLFILNGTRNSIIGVIERTVTSRLKFLDLRTWSEVLQGNIMKSFARSFTHISSLCLQSLPRTQYTPFLPANIVNLQLDQGQQHPFPHIQTYKLDKCTFSGVNNIDLQSLTILIVTWALNISSNCHVFLPALRELKLRTLSMGVGAKFEAPALDTLHFMNDWGPGAYMDDALLSDTNSSLLDPRYLLSPNSSIIADSYLPSTTLLNLLAKSPKVTNATLRFRHWAGAHEVLERVVGFKTEIDSHSVENVDLCPRLSELRLYFGWEASDSSASKEWLLTGLKARREAGITLPMSIYAGWKGEGTYVLLTGD